ncbi:MAG: methyltransferase [Blastococcus sp.]|nr:methyltransferase [Blastococcus sp.]
MPTHQPVPEISPAFIRAHTRPARPSLVPEVELLVADDVVALWEAIEDGRGTMTDPPFWAAAWPGGQALARFVLDTPAVVAGRTVLDLGAGSGLVAVAALMAGARAVIASEVDPYGMAAIAANAEHNGVGPVTVTGDLLDDEPDAGVDVVLAGDVCYDRTMSQRVLPYLGRAWLGGAAVYLGDPGRPYVPKEGLVEAAAFDVPDTEGPLLRRTTVWRLP